MNKSKANIVDIMIEYEAVEHHPFYCFNVPINDRITKTGNIMYIEINFNALNLFLVRVRNKFYLY